MKYLALTISLAVCFSSYAEWYFRGTPNNWGQTDMKQVSATQYETCQSFTGANPRFKIDRRGDWAEAYPEQDYKVTTNTSYNIAFSTDTHNINVEQVSQCSNYQANFTSLYFRGTPNNWASTKMELVADNTWQTTIVFDGKENQRFKFDLLADWSRNYGDNQADGTLEASGADIKTPIYGAYRVEVNDKTLAYTLTREQQCDTNCVNTLGAVYSKDKTTFSIWSPDTSDVKLWLDGQTYDMQRARDFNGYTQVYQVTVAGDHHLKKYNFQLNGITSRDPYGKMVEPNTNNNIVMDMSTTVLADGWSARPALQQREDAIIYEVHVRDFTIGETSGISSNHRGKFLGMVEAGSKYNNVSTGIDHLKELGVTHVQLMPVYDFASCPDVSDTSCYNWGYDPRNYNIPEERYSTTPTDYINRVREFKHMVNEFHRAGFRVIMDVVYNHTFQKEMFENISKQYYTDTDLSGTGNSIDANVPMIARMIQDSLEYWVDEYNIDGFRFDLIGIFDYDEVGAWGKHLNETFPQRNLLLYGEPWNGYASDPRAADRVRLGTIGRIHESRVGVFNPKYREAIKGKNDDGNCDAGDCFAYNNNPDTWRIQIGSRGAIRASNDASIEIDRWDPMFAMDPEQSINYVSAHDNLTLRDKTLKWADNTGVARDSTYLRRIQQFANGIVLTSQGIPFLHGGVEMMRDKKEDHNSYKSSDAINQYYWNWKIDNADILAYYKDVIALRKEHPGFRLNTWQEINEHVTSTRPRYGVVVNHIDARANGDSWSEIIVIYNSANNYTYPLPAGQWKVAMEKSDPAAGNGRIVTGSIVAEGTAVTVLYKE